MNWGGFGSTISGLFGRAGGGFRKAGEWLEQPQNIQTLGTMGAAFSKPDIITRGGRTFSMPSSGQTVGTAVAGLSGMQAYSAVTSKLSEGVPISEIAETSALSSTQLESALKTKQSIETSEYGRYSAFQKAAKGMWDTPGLTDEQKTEGIQQLYEQFKIPMMEAETDRMKVGVPEAVAEIRATSATDVATIGAEAQKSVAATRAQGYIDEVKERMRLAYSKDAASMMVFEKAAASADSVVRARISGSLLPLDSEEIKTTWERQFSLVMSTLPSDEGESKFVMPERDPIMIKKPVRGW